MENHNRSIRCDVGKCRHNVNGTSCALDSVKIGTDCTECTCCESFSSKDFE